MILPAYLDVGTFAIYRRLFWIYCKYSIFRFKSFHFFLCSFRLADLALILSYKADELGGPTALRDPTLTVMYI